MWVKHVCKMRNKWLSKFPSGMRILLIVQELFFQLLYDEFDESSCVKLRSLINLLQSFVVIEMR